MPVSASSPTAGSGWILIAVVIFIVANSGSSMVTVRAPSPKVATMGRDPVTVECLYRATGRDLVLAVNVYRKQTHDNDFHLVAQVPNPKFVSLPPTFVDKHLGTRANISIQTKGSFQSVWLTIRPATCEDEGTYQCEVQVYGGRTPRRPVVEVHLNEEPSTPSLRQTPLVLVEDYPVTFTCTGTMGRPVSRFKWYVYRNTHRDSVEEVEMSGISSFDKSAGTCSPLGSSTLAVMITRADQRVKCVLQQRTQEHVLKVSDERKLDVQYSVRDTSVRVEINSHYQNPEDEILAVEGDSVFLSCNSRGNPDPLLTWKYLPLNGQPKDSELAGLAAKSDLILNNLTTNHSASYVCVSTNFIRGRKHTETKTVRVIVKERFSASVGRLHRASIQRKYLLRYVMIGGIVVGAMLFVVLLSMVSVICYRKCTLMEDRKYLVQYHGVKA